MVLLGRLIVLAGCGLYIGAVGYAGWLGLQQPSEPDLGPYVPTILTAVGGALATVFGAAFGLSDGQRPPTLGSLLPRFNWPATATLIAWAYFLGLVVGVGFFAFDPMRESAALPIRDMWKTIVGVIVGVIYVLAGKPRSS
jgi:membrane associated rhomboid family serine protease